MCIFNILQLLYCTDVYILLLMYVMSVNQFYLKSTDISGRCFFIKDLELKRCYIAQYITNLLFISFSKISQ